ncbi:PREDICTED: protein BREAST CANCER SUSCEPTIBILITY 2 homolog B isoform X1 [Camelina sativa]|uniref:Protein BREAST CANCER SUSCEPTIBILITY 2 homolog B isoform X1 n=1 Tax=Camelina sativa TaxID=90675 RepID=A0ABM0V732_CAMSA|nr:PREDICTED: protein BREAST CANCER SUSCEPTIBILITY 2 homolog B isoform X1 [Camelina sativa]
MSTWQLFPDSSGDGFRWEVAGRILQSDSDDSTPTQALDFTTPLPSMPDLLLQGCSKLIEREESMPTPGEIPMFRTGLGKSVPLKESSIARAKSLLAVGNVASYSDLQNTYSSNSQMRAVDTPGTLPMFTTALGKSVPLKESSMAKALSILGGDKMNDSANVLPMESGFGVPNSFFQTASNKKVNVSSAGLARAKALLGLEEDDLNEFTHVNQSPSSHRQHEWSGLKTHEEFDALAVQHPSRTPGKFEDHVSGKMSEFLNPSLKVAPTKFQTADGKSLSVSAEALNRARNLLGDPELGTLFDDVAAGDQFVTPQKDEKLGDIAINSGSANTVYTAHEEKTSNKHTSNSFVSPLRSSSKQFRSVKLENLPLGGNLIKKFDAAVDEADCALNITKLATHGLSNNRPLSSDMAVNNSKENGFNPRAKQFGRPADQPLVDITNRAIAYANIKQESTQKKRLGKTVSVSPFKRPRISSFKTPLKKTDLHASSGLSVVSSDTLSSKKVLSTRYPERSPRVYIKDYFGMHPTATTKMDYVPDHVRRIKSSNADKYVFRDESSSNMVGAETFLQMLAESGASLQHASRKWVTNHYRWIVWKLACYEIYYPAKCRGNFLTVTNVLEELKYRYEREVNHGHCSAIKRILSGDAPASSMMVLCISAINPKTNNDSQETPGSDSCSNVKVELTDGWYSMNAALDVVLTKQLNAGKLFVGQKIRILGAGLSGWATPTSPLEAVISSTICLLLNINGTYRAHWADRLGFCKEVGVPLAFNCIKCNGGPVPKTLAGITRIYPILYKEKLAEKKSIVRSERMESKIIQLHNQRRSALVEGLMCEYQRGVNGFNSQNDTGSEEGAKVFKLLETAAEPELLMAEMSPEQLTSFTTYKAKYEAAKQMKMEKSVANALEDAGLGERNVTPFMRIRLVGLTSLSYEGEHNPKEGIVTIWNPTEKQRTELTEGKIYIMKGLVPMNSDSETLYLHARGSSSRWQPLSPKASESFQPFFNPRKPISLSNLDAYTDVQQKKQWLFVTDGSTQHSGEISNSLLAISFSTPAMDDISVPHISQNLVGSVVGFCNLIKRAKDARNEMWVGEATENSVYFINAEAAYSSHLRTSSAHIQKWAKLSSSNSVIHELRQRVLFIIGACKSPSC